MKTLHINKFFRSNTSRALFAGLIASATLISYSCKSTQSGSKAKDIGFSPSDVKADQPLMWQTDDNKKVHYGTCPVGSASVNRNCNGLAEKFYAMNFDKFSQDMVAYLVSLRSTTATTASTPSTQDAAALDKIKRLQDKITAGGLTPAAEASFKAQIAQLQAGLNATRFAPSVLTADETKIYDAIVLALQAGKDVVYDEGQDLFITASAPFIGKNSTAIAANCLSGGKPIESACWYKGQNDESCIEICGKLGSGISMAPETKTFAGSSGTDANCHLVGAAFGTQVGGQFQSNGIGCMHTSNASYRDTATTTDNAKTSNYARFCACK